MDYPINIFFGLTPSFIWLLFFLRKDHHPEPNRMVLKVFLYGMFGAILAALIELGLCENFLEICGEEVWNQSLISFLFYIFLGIAFVEEIVKYLIVRQLVIKSPDCDEPVDIMLYMIIVALGFAALENLLLLFPGRPFALGDAFSISFYRFIGATFLHALASGTLGYFAALTIYRKRTGFVFLGIIIATLLHGFYNLAIIKMSENYNFINIPIILLVGAAFFVTYGFKKLNKIKSICHF